MSDEKKVLSQNDITMIKVYYFLKDNPDRIKEDIPKSISRPDLKNSTSKVYSVSSDNWKFLKGINKDGTESKVGAILGFDYENGEIKLKISGAKSRAEISKRRIEKIIKEIEEGKFELEDISFEKRVITVDEQKYFLKKLDSSLAEYIRNELKTKKQSKNSNLQITVGDSKNPLDNNIHIKDKNSIFLEDIAQSINIKININDINSKIKYLTEKLKEPNITDNKKAKIEEKISEYKQELNKLIESNRKKEEEISKKYINDDKEVQQKNITNIINVCEVICNIYKEKIQNIEDEIEQINSLISTFDESKKQTPKGLKEFNNLLKKKEKLVKKKNTYKEAFKISKLEHDRYKEVLKRRMNFDKEEGIRDIHTNISNNKHNRETSTEMHEENENMLPNESKQSKKSLMMLIGYYDLTIFDKYRAKKEAFRKLNLKEPNIFRKIFLFLPSFKYSKVASDYIETGKIKIDDVIKNKDRYNLPTFLVEEKKNPNLDSYRLSENEVGISESERNQNADEIVHEEGDEREI